MVGRVRFLAFSLPRGSTNWALTRPRSCHSALPSTVRSLFNSYCHCCHCCRRPRRRPRRRGGFCLRALSPAFGAHFIDWRTLRPSSSRGSIRETVQGNEQVLPPAFKQTYARTRTPARQPARTHADPHLGGAPIEINHLQREKNGLARARLKKTNGASLWPRQPQVKGLSRPRTFSLQHPGPQMILANIIETFASPTPRQGLFGFKEAPAEQGAGGAAPLGLRAESRRAWTPQPIDL